MILVIAQRQQWDFREGREWNSSREKCLNKDLWNVLVLEIEMSLVLLGKIGRNTLPSPSSGSDHSLLGTNPHWKSVCFSCIPPDQGYFIKMHFMYFVFKKWYIYYLKYSIILDMLFYKIQRTFKDPPFRLWLIVNLPPHLKIIRVYLRLRYLYGELWELLLGSLGQIWQLILSGHRRKG